MYLPQALREYRVWNLVPIYDLGGQARAFVFRTWHSRAPPSTDKMHKMHKMDKKDKNDKKNKKDKR